MKLTLCLLALGLCSLSQPSYAAIFEVLAGSDYFTTQPGTMFNGVAFMGVPIGPGGSDTVVARTQTAALGPAVGGTGTTPLVMTQFELVTTAPTTAFGALDNYYVTLQSVRGGPASTGTMTITLGALDDGTPANPEGTFTSSLDVFFDIRMGSPTGTIVFSSELPLTNSGGVWDADPSPSDFLVVGPRGDVTANFHTGKINNTDLHDMDFFPVGSVTESAGSDLHVVTNTQTPEPGTLALIGGALMALARIRRRR